MRPLLVLLLILPVDPASAQRDDGRRFELRGKVVNEVSGEPVPGALVRLLPANRALFSGGDGSFSFSDLARGQYTLTVAKPGFFAESDLGGADGGSRAIPAEAEVRLKLTPAGVLTGRVRDENGDPLEGVGVRTERWRVVEGRRQLETGQQAVTDDEGNFRVHGIPPGRYLVSFSPVGPTGLPSQLVGQGYGPEYYPGVPDASSATPFELHAGEEQHLVHTYLRHRLYQLSGVVRGSLSTGSIVSLLGASGVSSGRFTRLDPKTGEFRFRDVAPGHYLLIADGGRTSGGRDPRARQHAILPVSISGDLAELVLALGSTVSASVEVHDETSSGGAPARVLVKMVPHGFADWPRAAVVPPPGPRMPDRVEDLFPATYSVEAEPQQSGYVAALRSGGVDLLREDLTVASGSPPPPIEVTLRNDGARLDIALPETGAGAAVVYSEEYPRRSQLAVAGAGVRSLSVQSLAPGTYRVFAVRDAGGVEYRNPEAVESCLARAARVTVGPSEQSSLRAEICEAGRLE